MLHHDVLPKPLLLCRPASSSCRHRLEILASLQQICLLPPSCNSGIHKLGARQRRRRWRPSCCEISNNGRRLRWCRMYISEGEYRGSPGSRTASNGSRASRKGQLGEELHLGAGLTMEYSRPNIFVQTSQLPSSFVKRVLITPPARYLRLSSRIGGVVEGFSRIPISLGQFYHLSQFGREL